MVESNLTETVSFGQYRNGHLPIWYVRATIPPMDATTFRTENMRRHVREAGGPKEFAVQYGGVRWSADQVSQWISEKNPKGIGRRLARDLEEAIGLDPGALDRPPGEAQAKQETDKRSPGLITNQLENDIDAIRFAVAGLIAVVAKERPAEGARVAAAIRSAVPKKFVVRGYLHTLLQTLDRAARAQASATAQPGARSRAKK